MLAVKGWVKTSDQSFGQSHDRVIKEAVSYKNQAGEILFHQVRFQNEGFVITSADDNLEPIVAFSNTSLDQIEPGNPIYALLQKDARARKHSLGSQTRASSN
ncbi:MAG: Spi family protease inhibitor, partial [Lentisphaeria bacterium]|nr:Spi family protease inhibitor [Lentisphaeria bacterium]